MSVPAPDDLTARGARSRRPYHVPVIDAAGSFASFVLQVLGAFRCCRGTPSEVLRQVGILAAGSVL